MNSEPEESSRKITLYFLNKGKGGGHRLFLCFKFMTWATKCVTSDQGCCDIGTQGKGTFACPGLLVQSREGNGYDDYFYSQGENRLFESFVTVYYIVIPLKL